MSLLRNQLNHALVPRSISRSSTKSFHPNDNINQASASSLINPRKMSQTKDPLPILDHIVILVSHATLVELPDRLKGLFTVVIGGEHANGLTYNNLILFEDGVYIELIAFYDNVDPEERKRHRWGQLEENTIVDWAYTLPHEDDFASLQGRVHDANAGYTYDDPVPGGRKRPDGEVLKWSTAAARQENDQPTMRGRLPFWCLDKTPRRLRVPYENNPQTQHPSGARGIARVALHVPTEELSKLGSAYSAVHQSDGNHGLWRVEVPSGGLGGAQAVSLLGTETKPRIFLTLLGKSSSPPVIEVLPGLIFTVEQ